MSDVIKENKQQIIKNNYWIIDQKDTKIGKIPVVSTKLIFKDLINGWKVRWGINRMNYKIEPGLYAVNNPNEESMVLVTANYKLTFDKLRKELDNIDAWILVLDTKGVNVWCASGKGTFGTKELISRIISSNLLRLITHNRLILPQLGATGVSAHIIRQNTGMKVIYGPVLAKDIPEFIKNNMVKTEKMKEVLFKLADRLAVVPLELVQTWKVVLIALGFLSITNFIESHFVSFNIIKLSIELIPFLGAILAGSLFVPVLLPYIPFRSFAIKGFILGVLWSIIISFIYRLNPVGIIINLLLLPSLSSFLALNFTGATTYTSLSGVKKEIKISIPIYITLVSCGIVLKIINLFVFKGESL